MTENTKAILAQGYFYGTYNDKSYVLYHCDEYIVCKHYSRERNRWFYNAHSTEDFDAFAERCFSLQSKPERALNEPVQYKTIVGVWE